ncbi:MAG: DMT family transporter [Nitrospinota bacterium]|nr:DMT family transporter [Nitrospinota bacterium]MDP7368986.1 DMT family transporter [Nitrospinota bacterium]MDP7505047.1 DMT family transporter [Nitrospinota bacterium]MDP7664189.1 DMT family transporter [Nitrospinota bacterium]
MREIGLAVASSFFVSMTYIFARLAGREVTPLLGGLITSVVIAALFLPWVLFVVPAREYANPSLLWYVGLGVFIPGLARAVHFASILRIGASPTALLRGLGPLFSSTFAVLLLGEALSDLVATGTGFIVLGIAALSIRKGEMRSWSLIGVLYGLAATWILVSRDLVVRYASVQTPYKTLAIFVMAATSVLVMSVAWGGFDKKSLASVPRRGLFFFVLVGFFGFLALTSLFLALERGNVVVVTPIVSSQPLFVMLLSRLFLEEMERITPLMILGGVFIALGGGLIGVGG